MPAKMSPARELKEKILRIKRWLEPIPEPPSGCGRVYVVISDKEERKLFAKAFRLMSPDECGSWRWVKKAYGVNADAIYVGYDNASGRPLAEGTALVAALEAEGFGAYRDEVGD